MGDLGCSIHGLCTTFGPWQAHCLNPTGLTCASKQPLTPRPQMYACPPQACLDNPSSCSLDDRFVAKGVTGCLDTAAEVRPNSVCFVGPVSGVEGPGQACSAP